MTTKLMTATTLLALTVGCASEPAPKAKAPATTPPTTQASVVPSPTADPVVLDDRIAAVCGIPTPKFAFDKARVKEAAQTPLNDLAYCLSKGALAGRDVLLVGHADPRGTVEYNLGLGHERAASVAGYLTDHGVSKEQIRMSSQGEAQADGYNAETWADDRRVEVLLPNS